MHVSTVAPCLHVADVPPVVAFYVEHLGFAVALDIGWFVSLRHPDVAQVDLCVVDREHAPAPELAGPVGGVVLALMVQDVTAEGRRLETAGVPLLVAPRDEPWGQRRLVVLDPAGTGVELVQRIDPDPEWLAAAGLA